MARAWRKAEADGKKAPARHPKNTYMCGTHTHTHTTLIFIFIYKYKHKNMYILTYAYEPFVVLVARGYRVSKPMPGLGKRWRSRRRAD